MSKEEEPPSWSPRGKEAAILEGSLPEVISPYLLDLIKNTGGITGPIGLQFIAQIESERANLNETNKDPLSEDENEVAPGLVYKYKSYTDEEGNFHPGRGENFLLHLYNFYIYKLVLEQLRFHLHLEDLCLFHLSSLFRFQFEQ